ncbi:hypothetical protein BKA70DRAFT_1422487 [Coprinopsis sp. MPI-PUGE-AT-0042]|nr:hypothetical protein BKA70DRAFT_1422487 [Coprinopsis sp. MPI-PUGE-AT-0042]
MHNSRNHKVSGCQVVIVNLISCAVEVSAAPCPVMELGDMNIPALLETVSPSIITCLSSFSNTGTTLQQQYQGHRNAPEGV